MKQLFVIFLYFTIAPLWAQADRTERREIKYKFVGEDSVMEYQKLRTYDAQGRLLRKEEFFYQLTPPYGILWKDETTQFDQTEQILTQRISYYKPNESPKMEKLEIKYRQYAASDDSSEVIWARRYDAEGELILEDTATYDDKGNLVRKCSYDYRNNTSLFCEHFSHNRRGKTTRWRMYARWTTVGAGGKAKDKQAKRRDIRYKYNRKGQYISAKGRYYTTNFDEKCTYDAQGRLASIRTQTERKNRYSKKDREKHNIKRKFDWVRDITERTYHLGKPANELMIEANHEKQKIVRVYPPDDTLIQKSETYFKKTLIETVEYAYTPQRLLQRRVTTRLDDKGTVKFQMIAQADAQGRLEREQQVIGDKVLSTTTFEYDPQGRLVRQMHFNQKGNKLETLVFGYK